MIVLSVPPQAQCSAEWVNEPSTMSLVQQNRFSWIAATIICLDHLLHLPGIRYPWNGHAMCRLCDLWRRVGVRGEVLSRRRPVRRSRRVILGRRLRPDWAAERRAPESESGPGPGGAGSEGRSGGGGGGPSVAGPDDTAVGPTQTNGCQHRPDLPPR